MKNLVVIVQARMGSSRLPGKVLLRAAGMPLLELMLLRLRKLRTPCEVVVATTVAAEDAPIRSLCRRLGVTCMSGHPTDLLERHYRVALELQADAVAKIPSDCPLIDPGIADRVFARFALGDVDFCSNLRPPSWPDGNDVEVMSFSALEAAFHEAKRDFEREHTTPFIWENPGRFRLANVSLLPSSADPSAPNLAQSHRFTLDYPEDHALIALVVERLLPLYGADFGLEQILELCQREPQLLQMNAVRKETAWYLSHLGDFKTLRRGPAGGLQWI
ncbi:MAG: NTP transferase domain-containing protein [Polyangiaceae bacterium]